MKIEDIKQELNKYSQYKEEFAKTLGLYRRKRQRRVVMSCLFWAAVSASVVLLLFLLSERTPAQSEFIRHIGSLALYGSVSYWLLKGIYALFNPPTVTKMAVEIEEASEKFNSGLSSAAEFAEANIKYPGTSEIFRKITVIDAQKGLKYEDLKVALKAFSRKISAFTMAVFMLLAGIWYLISPLEVEIGASRLVFPLRAIAPFSTLDFQITPGNTVVARGNDLQIVARPNRSSKEIPILKLFEPEKEEGTEVEMYPDKTATEAVYLYNLTGLQESSDYQISCEKFKSPRFKINVMTRPEVKELYVTVHQPAYIATAPLELPEGTGDCSVLIGTKIEIKGVTDQEISKALINLSPGATETCKLSGKNKFSYSFSVATDTTYSIYLENSLGLKNEKPVSYKIAAVIDASPTVELLKPGQDIPFPKKRMIELKAVTRDDFGVKTMILYYKIGIRQDPIPHNLKPDFSPMTEYQVDFPWPLDTLAVQPGTKITYYIQVEDACKPTPNIASTSEYHISMPSMYDLYKGEDNQHEDLAEKLQEYMEAQKLRKKSLMEAYEQIKHSEKLDFESQKAIEKAIEDGMKQQKMAEEIQKSFKSLQNNMEDNPLNTPEALERMQKVSDLMNEVMDEKTKKMMQELRESLKDLKLNPEDLKKYEEAFKMEDYLKGLDRTIDLLTQVKEQQKLNSLGKAIEDLHKRQQDIASKTAELEQKMKEGKTTPEDEATMKDLSDQQEKLKKEMEDLQEQAQKMAAEKSKDDLKDNPLMEEVKNIRDKMKQQDFRKMSDEISKKMQEKKPQEAMEKQRQMLKFLESLKKDADKICRACSGGQAPQLDLSRFIYRALKVSTDQESLLKKLKFLPGQFMRGSKPEIEGLIDEVSILQVQVKQQGAKLEQSLEKFIKSSFSVDPSVLDSMRGVQRLFAEIVKNLEDRSVAKSREDQQEIIRKFNILAMDLMRAQDQQGGGSSSSPMDALQQFKNLTKRQLSLYRKMMQQQGKPSPQMMQQLQRMAMEQRKVREALEKLMRESQNKMNTLGRMNKVSEEMKDLETQILDPKLRKKVAEKQKAIYERMLRAQKSIKNREEESEERKAEKSSQKVQKDPEKPITSIGSETRDLSKDFLSETREEYPAEYKNLLQDYFKSLNIYGEE